VRISLAASHAVAVLPSQRQVHGASGSTPHAAPPYVHVPPTHAFSTQ
jgi:hypothetical protein